MRLGVIATYHGFYPIATILLMLPNAGVKPRRTRRMGASIARMPVSFNEATTRRRLERLVRREGSRGGLSIGALAERPKPGSLSAP
jgi:hypothetical protein